MDPTEPVLSAPFGPLLEPAPVEPVPVAEPAGVDEPVVVDVELDPVELLVPGELVPAVAVDDGVAPPPLVGVWLGVGVVAAGFVELARVETAAEPVPVPVAAPPAGSRSAGAFGSFGALPPVLGPVAVEFRVVFAAVVGAWAAGF